MKWRGSSGGGGVTRDVEPERCRLAGMVFLGAVVVTYGLKSEKKNAHKKKQEINGRAKTGGGKKNGQPRVFIGVRIRVASPR